MRRRPPISTLFPYTTLFRSNDRPIAVRAEDEPTFRVEGEAVRARLATGERRVAGVAARLKESNGSARSEEHTSELQSRQYLVCRLLLEKKKRPAPLHKRHTR